MNDRAFRGLTEVDGLSDSQVHNLVLGNWEKLNGVLRARPPASALRRLLRLEWHGRPRPRAYVLRRLRVALNRANNREALAALGELVATRAAGRTAPGDLLGRATR